MEKQRQVFRPFAAAVFAGSLLLGACSSNSHETNSISSNTTENSSTSTSKALKNCLSQTVRVYQNAKKPIEPLPGTRGNGYVLSINKIGNQKVVQVEQRENINGQIGPNTVGGQNLSPENPIADMVQTDKGVAKFVLGPFITDHFSVYVKMCEPN